MKRNLAAAIVAAFAIAAIPAWAGESHHGHASGNPYAALQLDAGRKWATDEPLRRHMGELRETLATNAAQRHPSREQYRALGESVERSVAGIVRDCKLEPRADENLHVVVAELVQAADQLQGKSGEKPARGAARAARALDMYSAHFDHPGWKPVPRGKDSLRAAS